MPLVGVGLGIWRHGLFSTVSPYALSGALQAQSAALAGTLGQTQDMTGALTASSAQLTALATEMGSQIQAVIRNGVSDYDEFTTAPTGAASTTTIGGAHAREFQSDGSAMTIAEIQNGTGIVLSLRRTATNTIELKGFQSDASTSVFSNTTAAIPASTGPLLILWDASGTTAHLYVITLSDGTTVTGTNTPGSAGAIDITGVWSFGRSADGSDEYEDAIVYYDQITDEYPDFSGSDAKEEFYDSTNHGLRNPGTDGSNSWAAQPLVCLQNPSASHNVNSGSGGNTDAGSNSGDDTSIGTWEADYSAGDGNQRLTAITIDATQVSDADTADITNLPVLISEAVLITNASEALDADGSFPMQTDGGDLKFYSDAGLTTRLACEVVSVSLDNDPNNSTLQVWVLVPTVDYNDDTTIYMTYASTSGTESQPAVDAAYGRNAVWSGFDAVYHLEDTTDSTENGNDLDTNGTPTLVAAKIGNGYDCDIGDDFSNDSPTITTTKPCVFSGWLNPDVVDTYHFLACYTKSNTNPSINIGQDATHAFAQWYSNGSNNCSVTGTATLSAGTAYYITGRVNSDASIDLFLNGASDGNSSATGTWNATARDGIRVMTQQIAGFGRCDGKGDEVRFWPADRTDGWIATDYATQNAPGTFATAGTPSSI